jgi:hypothetical protein
VSHALLEATVRWRHSEDKQDDVVRFGKEKLKVSSGTLCEIYKLVYFATESHSTIVDHSRTCRVMLYSPDNVQSALPGQRSL